LKAKHQLLRDAPVIVRKQVGVIGCGRWGSKHLKALQRIAEDAQIDTIVACDVNTIALERVRSMGFEIHDNPETLIDVFQLDAVIIATPNDSHFELGKQFLLKGVDVFLEKPLATTFDDASSLVSIAIQEGKALKSGFLLRFHPCIVDAKQQIRLGRIGAIQAIHYRKKSIRPWDGFSYALDSLAIHGVDMAEFLLDGQTPLRISEVVGSHNSTELTLEYPNQVEIHLDVGWDSDEDIGELEVVGANGKIFVTLQDHCKYVIALEDNEMIFVECIHPPLEGVILDFLCGYSPSIASSTGSILRTIECIEQARLQLITSGRFNIRELKG